LNPVKNNFKSIRYGLREERKNVPLEPINDAADPGLEKVESPINDVAEGLRLLVCDDKCRAQCNDCGYRDADRGSDESPTEQLPGEGSVSNRRLVRKHDPLERFHHVPHVPANADNTVHNYTVGYPGPY